MAPKKKTLSEEEFLKVSEKLRLNQKTNDIAYGVLVLGKKQKLFAEKYNVTASAISALCARIYNSLKNKPGKLSEEEFLKVSEKLRLNQKTNDIAYGVLVLGKKQKFFAEKYNVTASAISFLCARVYDSFQKEFREVPEGYERVNVILPEYKAFIVKQWAKNQKKGG